MTPSTTSNSVTRHHPRVSPKKKMTIPQSLIPPNRAKINIKLAEGHWCYANHFDKNLPKSNPEDRHLQKYADILRSVLDNTYNKLHDRLLEHLQHLTRKYGILATSFENHSSKNIDSIHKAVLSSTHRFSDQYLSMVLEFLKMPQKQEVEWLRLATEDVKNQYDIEFEFGKRNFVQEHAKKHSMTYIIKDFVVEWHLLVLSGMIVYQVNKKGELYLVMQQLIWSKRKYGLVQKLCQDI